MTAGFLRNQRKTGGHRPPLQFGLHETLQLFDRTLISFVKRPLLDSLRSQESRVYQKVQMFTCSGLTHLQFAGNEKPTDSILHQISIHLRWEMLPRRLQPLENPASGIAGNGAKSEVNIHMAIRQLPKYNFLSWPSATKK